MHVLVLGRSGQLARSLIEGGAHAGHVVTAVGRPELELTVTSIEAAIDRFGPDVVVNAAAYTAVDKAEAEPEAAFAANAAGAKAAAAATSARRLPLIHVSTDYVFDGRKPEPYVETDPTAPLGIYGRSKLEGEQAVAAGNPRHLIVRTAWVISPFGNNFCKTMLRLALERPELRVVADQIGSPTFAPDLAAALIGMAKQMQSADADDRRWGIYHAANTGTASWHELATAIVAEAARYGRPQPPVHPITTADYPTPAQRPGNSRLYCSKLARTFDIVLPPWQNAVQRCVSALAAPELRG